MFNSTKHMDTSSFLAYSYLFAVPFTAMGSVWIEKFDYTALNQVDWVVAGWVLAFEVILLSVAMVLWKKLIAVNGVSKIAPFSTLRIVFGIAAGVIMFDDPLNWQILLGSALVTIGVVLTMKEFSIILKARTKSVLVYRNAHRVFMERRLKRISLRKRHR
jgi:drug/metabolite transporter (DMT)-like permease